MPKSQTAYKEHPLIDHVFPIRLIHNYNTFYFPPHYHKELEMIYVNIGTLEIEVNHIVYELSAGDLMVIGGNHIHAYRQRLDIDHVDYYMLLLDWQLLEAINKDQQSYEYLYPLLLKLNLLKGINNTGMSQVVKSIFDGIALELLQKNNGYKLSIISYLYRLLIVLVRELDKTTTHPKEIKALEKEHSFISTINDFIYNNYTQKITLEEASLVSGYSLYHFTRLFKKYTGFTFKQYLANFRISMVKEDLYNKNLSITYIAYKHGFGSIKTFNRTFKEINHQSPRDFRKAISDQY